MDRPVFNELHTRQNYVYATDVLEARSNKPLTATNVLEAVTAAFIMGAGATADLQMLQLCSKVAA
jgi:hypothetical protein